MAQPGSRPVRYALINKHGDEICRDESPLALAVTARRLWPDEEQDEDRTGRGWSIQEVVSR